MQGLRGFQAFVMGKASFAIAALLWCGLQSAWAADQNAGPITVIEQHGSVTVSMRGEARPTKAGAVITPPATIRTGTDGAIEIKQGSTTVAIASNSTIDLIATARRGDPLDRIVQARGSAFYKVGKREGQRLRVETPYLVAVVKGTQFNVVAQSSGATVALFEGLLEIRASDDTDVVDINAGEIAVRDGTQPTIRVLRMNTGETIRAGLVSPTTNGTVAGDARVANGANTALGATIATAPVVRPLTGTVGGAASVAATAGVGANGANVDARLNAVGATVGANVNLGASGLATDLKVNAPVIAGANVGVTAGLNLSQGTAGVSTGASLAGVSSNVGVGANLANGSLNVNSNTALAGLNVGATIATGANGAVGANLNVVGVGLTVNTGSAVTAPTLTTPAITTPVISTPAISAPVALPSISTPVSSPTISTPALSTPAVSIPAMTIPAVTTPLISTPAVTLPSVGGILGGLTGNSSPP